MSLTIDQAWAEFKLADLSPTAIDNQTFQARCPVCSSWVFVANDNGRVDIQCWEGGCDRTRIANELTFRTGAAMLNGQPKSPEIEVSHVSLPLRERDVGQRQFSTRAVDLTKLRPVRFMWRPWLIQGRLNLFVGEEASGKSTLQGWLASEITRGKLPGERENNPGDILYVGADEDDWYEIVTPRLHAMNADLARVREFVPINDSTIFNVVDHIAELDRELQEHPFSLVVFEQLMDVLPRMHNPNDPVEIRRVLRPLRRMLAAREVTGLGTLHVNKATADQLRQRMQGSMQFGALSRSTILVDKHPEDEDRRVAVLGKANYVASPVAISFRIDSYPFLLNNSEFDVGRVADVQDDDATVADVLARHSRADREREHDERLEQVAGTLGELPLSVRAVAEKADVPRSTTHRLLKELAEDERAQQTPDGWVSHVPAPLRERDVGQDQEMAQLDDYRRHRDRMLGESDD